MGSFCFSFVFNIMAGYNYSTYEVKFYRKIFKSHVYFSIVAQYIYQKL
ncbi:hypothetical protein HPS174_0757 [Glaesserella parasuis 174]|nr:hypothetical protein HPS174_0757 [Glaesserella parasuis 174]